MEPEIGFAWAAGLFEGEGSICAAKAGNTTTMKIHVGMADKDIIERFHSIVGCGTVGGPYAGKKAHHKPMYFWRLGRRSEQIEFINRIWPYLGERRRQQVVDVHSKITPITKEGSGIHDGDRRGRWGKPNLQAVA